ncbi:Smad4 [Oopsacas minuta]|uniref:Mothers against decapentaplegic homolog n=1 Tax=Oopsacas minuta TaxID=111878 RepID=A0AAV7KDC5_9METZ|nr:Smad4 [Oopsacas minuta]
MDFHPTFLPISSTTMSDIPHHHSSLTFSSQLMPFKGIYSPSDLKVDHYLTMDCSLPVNTLVTPSFSLNNSGSIVHSQFDSVLPFTNPPTPMSDACISIVTSLLCHRKGGESETFARKAIESLVKKLKDKRDELESLVVAVTSGGAQPSKCVTIPRTLDGRLQVAGRKGFPHVIYSKLWRWPDLQKNELKHAKFCQYAFDLKCESVCVNPYHYERVVSLVSFPNSEPSSGILLHHTATPPLVLDHVNEEQVECLPSNLGNDLNPQVMLNPMIQHSRNSDMPFPSIPTLYFSSNSHSSPNDPLSIPISTGSKISESVINSPINLQDQTQSLLDSSMELKSSNSLLINQCILPKLPWPEYWCTISYFELESQVGELFKVPSHSSHVIIDGYVDPAPAGDRFCLGRLSNVHRNSETDRVRLHIGRGIKLEHHPSGDVHLCCLSEHSVFVQSFYLDREAGRPLGEAVHKIYPNAWLKVFDLASCYQEMQHQSLTAKTIHNVQTAAVQGANSVTNGPPSFKIRPDRFGGIGVDDLRKLCILRLSFVKGWGPDYRRSCIKETPCWIEVQLNRALQLLDTVLLNMPQDIPVQD